MIDQNTGEITIESVPIRFGADFSRGEFLHSPLVKNASVFVKNEPYCSYQIGTFRADDLSLIISLWFFGKKLESVELVHHTAEQFGSSWADWTEENELKRKAIHDAWLEKQLGKPPYIYDWGAVSSVYDERSGGSSIVVRYSFGGEKWKPDK